MPRKSDIDPVFMRQIEALQAVAAAEFAGRSVGGPVPTALPAPGGWNGDLQDRDGLSLPFDRSVSNEALIASVRDASDPGTTGDVVATTIQIDVLAAMERAFRARHLGFVRSVALSLGRKAYHGAAGGPLKRGFLDYVSGILARS